MSNLSGLSRIDSRIIGESEAEPPEVLEAEAMIAAQEAGLSATAIEKIRTRSIVGRFASSSMSGFITGNLIVDMEKLEAVIEKLDACLNGNRVPGKPETLTPEQLVAVASAMINASGERTAKIAVLLKSAEIGANRGRRKTRQDNAPQRINGQFFNGPTQIINGRATEIAPAKPAE